MINTRHPPTHPKTLIEKKKIEVRKQQVASYSVVLLVNAVAP